MKTRLKKRRGRGRPAGELPRDGRHYTPPAKLAKLIRDARLSLGRKAFAVALEASLSCSRYYEIESADFLNPPPLATLLKIAAVLRINEDAIMPLFTECSRNVI